MCVVSVQVAKGWPKTLVQSVDNGRWPICMVGAAEQEGGMIGFVERQFWKAESRGKRLRD